MSTTHTPGPWAIQGQWSVDTPQGAMLAECIESPRGGIIGAWIGCGDDGRAENARLVAAAPELLEALKLCANSLRVWTEEDEQALAAAEAAIEAASGGFCITRDGWRGSPRELDANSRLVAAAPELLKAMNLLIDAAVETYDGQTSEFPALAAAVESAVRAIAKAEGLE